MQVLIIATILGYASCGRLEYLPPRPSTFASSSGAFGPAPGAFGPASGASVHSASYSGSYSAGPLQGSGQQIPILRQDAENNGDGTYRYNYETANGISAHEEGDARGEGTRAHGGFSYTAPDGQPISITYTADENGFQAQGAHLPTPPPIPEEIQRSIEQNLADEARGVVDNGQYRAGSEGQYGSAGAPLAAPGGYKQSHLQQGGYRY